MYRRFEAPNLLRDGSVKAPSESSCTTQRLAAQRGSYTVEQ
jgi:hypothetical protein